MGSFDVVLFDLGGVVLTDSWDGPERERAAKHFNLDPEKLHAGHHAYYDGWDRGKTTLEVYLNEVVFDVPQSFTREEFVAFMMSESRLLPNGAMETLKELAASGKYIIGSLNNEPRETNEYRFKTFELRKYLQLAFASCYLGVRKPEPAIFRLALDVMGKPAERVVFIDDRVPNVEAAAAMGIHAIHFTGDAELRQELKRLNVL